MCLNINVLYLVILQNTKSGEETIIDGRTIKN